MTGELLFPQYTSCQRAGVAGQVGFGQDGGWQRAHAGFIVAILYNMDVRALHVGAAIWLFMRA